MIELIGVEKSYRTRFGKRPIIRPTDLVFYRGSSTAVLGLIFLVAGLFIDWLYRISGYDLQP